MILSSQWRIFFLHSSHQPKCPVATSLWKIRESIHQKTSSKPSVCVLCEEKARHWEKCGTLSILIEEGGGGAEKEQEVGSRLQTLKTCPWLVMFFFQQGYTCAKGAIASHMQTMGSNTWTCGGHFSFNNSSFSPFGMHCLFCDLVY